MSNLNNSIQLPPAMESALRAVDRKTTRIGAFEGLALTGAVLLALMMLAMAIDWLLVLFDTRGRLVLTLGALVATGMVFFSRFVRPMIKRPPLSSVAQAVDAHVPKLQERWSTVTELAEADDPPEMRGASALIEQVSREAEAMSPLVAPGRIASRRRLFQYATAFALAAGVLAAAFLAAPGETEVLLKRFWAPAANISQTRLLALTGDVVIPKKESLVIETGLEGRRTGSATLIMEAESGEKQAAMAKPAAASATAAFVYTLRGVEESFRYRIRSGDGQSEWHTVTAVERPGIAQIRFRITPPDYSNLPSLDEDGLPGQCRALAGSRLVLDVTPTKPIDRLELRDDAEGLIRVAMAEKPVYRYSAILNDATDFSILLTDEYGFTNNNPPACRVTVYIDQPPRVQIVTPEDDIEARPDAIIPIDFEASDDMGITLAELVVTTESVPGATREMIIPIPLGGQEGAKEIKGHADLDLSKLDLKQGQELTYAVRVTDTQLARARSSNDHPDSGNQNNQNAAGSPDSASPMLAMAGSQESGESTRDHDESNDVRDAGDGKDSGEAAKNSLYESRSGDDNNKLASSQNDNQSKGQGSQSDSKSGSQLKNESSSQPRDQSNSQPGEQGSRPSDDQKESGAQPDQKEDVSNQQAASSGQSGSPQEKKETDPSEAGSQPPPNDMQKRPMPGQCSACSSSRKIKVDEWAGSFEGQAGEKLRLAIDEYMKRMDAALAEALKDTDAARTDIRVRQVWEAKQKSEVKSASGQLTKALAIVHDLRQKSDGTPYMMIGLQLQDISDQQVSPAIGSLVQAQEARDHANRLKELNQAWFLVDLARKRLADLNKTYEQVKKQQKLAEEVERVAKMYQVFVEDMNALMTSSKPSLNPRTGKMTEVSEEYVKKLEELLEQKKKLMAELAEVLSRDPELLKRFMAQQRLESTTIRDQLTLLAMRQAALSESVTEWQREESLDIAVSQNKWVQALGRDQMSIASDAAKLHENMVTWQPLDTPAALAKDIGNCTQKALEASLTARDAAMSTAADRTTQALEQAETAVKRLEELLELLSMASVASHGEEKMAAFTSNRMTEARALFDLEEDWIEKANAARHGDYGVAASVDQGRLTEDTHTFSIKINGLIPTLGRVSPEIGAKARELGGIMETEVLPHQNFATGALRVENLLAASAEAGQAVSGFAKAETAFDELLTLVEEASANCPPPNEPCPLPTLEEILKSLENEARACEKLGAACRRLNVAIQSDWQKPGSSSGSGQGSNSSGNNPDKGQSNKSEDQKQQETKMAKAMADAQARAAQATASRIARQLQESTETTSQSNPGGRANFRGKAGPRSGKTSPVELGDADGEANANERDWNTFVSKLQDELKQGRESNPPEQYRDAIQEYFRAISEAAAKESR